MKDLKNKISRVIFREKYLVNIDKILDTKLINVII
jgi:hypothetical protein